MSNKNNNSILEYQNPTKYQHNINSRKCVQCKKHKYNKRSENKINAFEYLNNDLFKVRMLMNKKMKRIKNLKERMNLNETEISKENCIKTKC